MSDSLVKEKLFAETERYFGQDKKRMDYARQAADFAQRIVAREMGHPVIVLAAATLHDIGAPEAEKKYGSVTVAYLEKEGPAVARGILEKLGVDKKIIDEVCAIIGSHHVPGQADTLNSKIVSDAYWLVNLKSEYKIASKADLTRIIDQTFLTPTGKEIARNLHLA